MPRPLDGLRHPGPHTAFDELPEPPLPGQWPFVAETALRDVHLAGRSPRRFPPR